MGTLRVALDTSFAGVNETGVGLYSLHLASGLADLAKSGQLELACFGPSCRSLKGSRFLGGLYREWPTYTQIYLPLALAKSRPHVVHSTSHVGPLWGQGRKVVTVHDLIFRRYPDDYNPFWLATTRACLPKVLSRAVAVIVDSITTGRDLQRFYRVSGRKIRVIYPGIDERFRAPAPSSALQAVRKRFNLLDAPYVLCMGPWVRRKNIAMVIKAFEWIAEVLPSARLVITGRPAAGMQSAGVVEALSRLPAHVKERVRTVGHLPGDDLVPLLQGAAVLAYPSLYEGFGLPPLEAMASGVPVVVSDAPVLAEVTGGAALVARAISPHEWAEALLAILTDGRKARELSEKGKTRTAHFTWQRCIRETLEVYHEVSSAKEPN